MGPRADLSGLETVLALTTISCPHLMSKPVTAGVEHFMGLCHTLRVNAVCALKWPSVCYPPGWSNNKQTRSHSSLGTSGTRLVAGGDSRAIQWWQLLSTR